MAWSNSKVFAKTILDILSNTTAIDLNSDGFLLALYGNTITPDNTVTTAALASYNGAASQWVTGGELSDSTNWDAGGEPLTSVTFAQSSAVLTFDAADTAQGGATCTLTNVYGGLVYDSTVTTPADNQALCYNYFGGANSVSGGTFTVVHSASGIATFTYT